MDPEAIHAALDALREDGLAPERTPHPLALRLPPGAPVLTSRAWRDGLVELQDAGSQAVAEMTGAQPGETVLDYKPGGPGRIFRVLTYRADHPGVQRILSL